MRHFTKIKQQQQQEKTSEKIKFIKMMMAKKTTKTSTYTQHDTVARTRDKCH